MPRFQTKPIEVEAVQLRCSYRFGSASGRAGDWLVTHADGRQEIVKATVFLACYDLVRENGTRERERERERESSKPSARRRPQPTGGRPAKTGRGIPTDPSVLARIRQQYEAGVPVTKITAAFGRSAASIYSLASAGRWKRPPGRAWHARRCLPTPKGEHLRGRVRCAACQSMTEYDPCEHCGKAIAFKG